MHSNDNENPTNPTDSWMLQDSDGDGLTNQTEIILGTDPYNPDSDRDGLLDSQELFMGSNPLVPELNRDWGIDINSSPFLHVKQIALTALADGFTLSQIQNYLIELPELRELESQKAEKLAHLAIRAVQFENALNSLADSEQKQNIQSQTSQEKTLRRNIS